MNRFNPYKIGITMGLIPMAGLILMLLAFWISRAYFAVDLNITRIGFFYILFSIPIVFIGFILTFAALFRRNETNLYKTLLGLFLISANAPLLLLILAIHGTISGRAYLKVCNNSGKEIEAVSIVEPDRMNSFGFIGESSTKIIHYDPDYASKDGIPLAGISQNFLVLNVEGKIIRRNIPIIHPGEIHLLVLDSEFKTSSIQLNKK